MSTQYKTMKNTHWGAAVAVFLAFDFLCAVGKGSFIVSWSNDLLSHATAGLPAGFCPVSKKESNSEAGWRWGCRSNERGEEEGRPGKSGAGLLCCAPEPQRADKGNLQEGKDTSLSVTTCFGYRDKAWQNFPFPHVHNDLHHSNTTEIQALALTVLSQLDLIV